MRRRASRLSSAKTIGHSFSCAPFSPVVHAWSNRVTLEFEAPFMQPTSLLLESGQPVDDNCDGCSRSIVLRVEEKALAIGADCILLFIRSTHARGADQAGLKQSYGCADFDSCVPIPIWEPDWYRH